MANGGTESCMGANDVCLDLSDDDSSKQVAEAGTVDANDYGDDNDDDNIDDDDDRMDNYDDDDEDDFDDDDDLSDM
jgi:hypothetical protein